MSTKLHVGSIPSDGVEDDLKATFGEFGQVDSVDIARDSATGPSKSFAIVAMSQGKDAVAAIGRLDFTHYLGSYYRR